MVTTPDFIERGPMQSPDLHSSLNKKTSPAGRTESLQELRLQVSDSIGDIIAFWGFKRVLGRIWTLLYLSPRPLTAAEICDELQLSTGACHMAVQEMDNWGIIRKKNKPGSKQILFEAETDIWRMVCRVVASRELRELEKLTTSIGNLLQASQSWSKLYPRDEQAKHIENRLKQLHRMSELGTEAFRLLFQEKHFELAALQKIAQIRQWFFNLQ